MDIEAMSREVSEMFKTDEDNLTPQIEPDRLKTLQQLREKALVTSMRAQELDMEFRRQVAEACFAFKVPINDSIVCLGCGRIRSKQVPQCPVCMG